MADQYDEKLDYSQLVFEQLSRMMVVISQPEIMVKQFGRTVDGLDILCGFLHKSGSIPREKLKQNMSQQEFYNQARLIAKQAISLLEANGYLTRKKKRGTLGTKSEAEGS